MVRTGKWGKAMSAGIMAESDMQIVAAVDLKSVETDFWSALR